MLDGWSRDGCDEIERTRRLVDLFFVSVLLDAGAGDDWKWTEPGHGHVYERSEGIAVASLYMFKELAFTIKEDTRAPLVDGKHLSIMKISEPNAVTNLRLGKGLKDMKTEILIEGFQISESNPMLGVESRADLLRSLGTSLLAQPEVFGTEGRPGNLVGKAASSRL